MQIDLSFATLEWLDQHVERQLATPNQAAYYRAIKRSEQNAFTHYVMEHLDLYVDRVTVSANRVTFYKGELNREEMQQLMDLEFKVDGGVAVLSSLDTELYFEPYCEDASSRMEITFSVQK